MVVLSLPGPCYLLDTWKILPFNYYVNDILVDHQVRTILLLVLIYFFCILFLRYFPGVTLKEILDSLAGDVLKIKTVPGQPHEVVDSIATKLRSTREPDIFIVIHNLDGEALRSEKTQSVLSNMAALPKIHLLASIDHINSPLLWDQNKLSQFNFIWEDATSFLPYYDETSFESSLMVQRSGTIALTALRNVFQSLNTNARKVIYYRIYCSNRAELISSFIFIL